LPKKRIHLANRFLSSLPLDDFEALLPHIESVDLKRRTILYETDALLTHAYLPQDCIISLLTFMNDGQSVEMAAIGSEGMIGAVAAPATRRAIGQYSVQIAGSASRIPMADLDRIMVERPAVRHALWHVNEAIMSQTLFTVACNAVHSVEARCCRWILSTRDRLGRDSLPLTHESLAEMLGVQRSTVSAIVRQIQTAGLVSQRRGCIAVSDRAGLERLSCECYGRIKDKFDRLLPRSRGAR